MTLNDILAKLDSVKQTKQNQYTCKCPAHDDNKNSLMINFDDVNKKTNLFCQAGCSVKDILKALNVVVDDLYSEQILIAKYDYVNDQGVWQYSKYRYNGKRFSSTKIDKHILYNLPAVIKNDVVYMVEGEKDADNLIKLGIVATTVGSVSNWRSDLAHYFKGKDLVIIADNDNAGLNLAQKIYDDCKGVVKSIKKIKSPIGKDISDFIEATPDDTKDKIEAIKEETQNMLMAISSDNKLRKSKENLEVLMRMNKFRVYYDVISKRKIFENDLESRTWQDTDTIELMNFGINQDFCVPKTTICDFIETIALKNTKNPVVEYLEGLEYDPSRDYIKEMYSCLNLKWDTDLHYKLFKTWLTQCVVMAHNTRGLDKGENILILQGGQGLFKTTYLKKLCPDVRWFKDGVVLDPANKDTVKKANEFWITELGEIDSTLKSEQAALKAFLSETFDKFRMPYAREMCEFPRTTSFCGSVNEYEFLKDSTGSRRFWIFEIDTIDIKKQESIDIDAFWAQVYHGWKYCGDKHFLTVDEIKMVDIRNYKYNIQTFGINYWVEEFGTENILDHTLTEVYDAYCMSHTKALTKIAFSREIQKLLGCQVETKWISGKTTKIFK